jgi:hypothetical protein
VLNNPSSFFGNQGIIGYRPNPNFYILMLPNGRMEYRATLGGQTMTITSLETACVNGWSHVALVYHQPTGQLTAYFNGLVAGTATAPAVNLVQNNEPFRIGRQLDAGNNFWFNGRIDNAALINRALTQQEVLQYAFQDIPDDDADVVLYYKMNQDSGTNLLAETGANAALSGGYSWVESTFSVLIPEGNNAYAESLLDDGSVTNDDPFHIVLYHATFNAEIGDDLIAEGKALITNLPDGLEASLNVIDAQTALLSISGSALANDVADSVNNAELRLLTGALNEHCGWLGYPLTFTFIECLLPELELTVSATEICQGESVTLTASGALNYLWDNGAEGDEVVLSLSETTTVSVLASNDDGCGQAEASMTITVFEPQQITLSPDVDTDICPGSSLTLIASEGFEDYLWSTGQEGASLTVVDEGDFSVTATDQNGCVTQSESIQIGLHATLVPEISADEGFTFCPGETLILVVDDGFVTYQWNVGGEGSTILVSTAGDYFVSVTDGNGCVTTSEPVTVVESVPGAFSFNGETSVDENSTSEYSITGDGLTVEWELTGGTIVAEDDMGITVLWAGPGNASITYFITNDDGCTFGPFTEDIQINIVIGIDEETLAQPRAYPNPVTDVLTFALLDHPAGRPCLVFNSAGQVVDSFTPLAAPFVYPVSHLANGVYFIAPEDRSWVVKFVK